MTQIPLLAISLPANLIFSLKALEDVSNLNIIPKTYVEWAVQTLTGIKKKSNNNSKKGGGLINNIGYLVIIIVGAIAFVGFIFLLHYISSRFPK